MIEWAFTTNWNYTSFTAEQLFFLGVGLPMFILSAFVFLGNEAFETAIGAA